MPGLNDWVIWDPARLARERAEVPTIAPNLQFLEPGDLLAPHAGWHGDLPVWPFDRPAPDGIEAIVPTPLKVLVRYSAVHPVVAPSVVPLDPEPEPMEVSLSKWHVLPDGSLCLLQSQGMWIPEASTNQLLLKASGWRIEYALMRHGASEMMTVNGIVSDDRLDAAISEAAVRIRDRGRY